jgi:glycosyltransferase involved in cell wall biosynthesis
MSGLTPTPVINCTLYRDNPYQAMLYAPLAGRYAAIRGSVEDALEARRRDPRALLHVHWEEHILRGHPTSAEARIAVDYFIRTLHSYRREGGRLAWTIHNGHPHEQEHVDLFLQLRSALAELADRILVHNTEAINVLSDQVALDRAKVFYLPHPSYLGVYESEAELAQALPVLPGNSLLMFGKLRRYKAIERLLEELPPEHLAPHGATIEIRGEPLAGDDYLPELRTRFAERRDIIWDVRRIPDGEVPGLLRGARAVVLPYERFLTSGVALLCLSLGVPLIGPRTRPLEEVVPAAAQSLLFDPGVPGELARAVDVAFALPPEQYLALREACIDRARHFHPQRIGRLLRQVYAELGEVVSKGVAESPG